MKEPLFLLENIGVEIKRRTKPAKVLDNVNLDIQEGEMLGLIGETGSGKSMLARLIIDLLPANSRLTHGQILHRSTNYTEGRSVLRGRIIAMVFQDPMQSLNPVQRIGKQFVIVLKKRFGYSIERAYLEARDWLDKAQISNPDNILNRFPHQLSGGQMQRIMIAISMAVKPEFLIADEATTALDANIKLEIINLINSLRNEMNTTVLFISHDLLIAKRYCDRIAVMNKGRIVEVNKTINIFNHPKHVYTKTLIGGLHKLMGKSNKKEEQAEKNILMSVKNIKKSYTTNKENTYALEQVSLDIYKKETLGIIGESGSGKTTLAKIILNILQRDYGSVILFNGDGSKKNITRPNPRIGAVFQDPLGSLNPRMTVSDIVAEPLIVSGCKNKLEIEEIIEKTINKVNLETDLLNRFPQMLSGGQRQKVSIARALVLRPDLLVLDEPTSSLDIHVQGIVLDLLKELQHLEKLTYLFISHDLGVLAKVADRVAVLYQGRIIEQGITEEILYNPREKYTEKLISAFFDNNI